MRTIIQSCLDLLGGEKKHTPTYNHLQDCCPYVITNFNENVHIKLSFYIKRHQNSVRGKVRCPKTLYGWPTSRFRLLRTNHIRYIVQKLIFCINTVIVRFISMNSKGMCTFSSLSERKLEVSMCVNTVCVNVPMKQRQQPPPAFYTSTKQSCFTIFYLFHQKDITNTK